MSSAGPLRRALAALSGGAALLLGVTSLVLPSPYLVESPGPIFNTIGESEGEPIISLSGTESYPTSGSLSLTTVYVSGQPTSTVRVPEAAYALFSPEIDLSPHELTYPSGTTEEQVQEQNTAAMTSSQDLALAAALDHQGIEYDMQLSVMDFTPEALEAGAAEQLQPGDRVLAVGEEPVTGIEGLRQAVNEAAGGTVDLTVARDRESVEVQVPTYQELDGDYYVGLLLANEFDFPVTADIQLEHVGGPSAGLMFSLGIIDQMTEDDLTGGLDWAGTGTVDPDGTVGPIGGIAQKVVGARDGGADHFLAPRDNCPELEGRIPDQLQVYGVDTVDQAVEVVQAVREGDGELVNSLEPCGA